MAILFKQDLKHLFKGSGNAFMLFFFPAIVTLLLGFLVNNSYTSSLLSSYDFYGVTMIFFMAMMGATIPANLFLEKHLKAPNTRIFYSPVSRVSIYLSKILSSFIFISVALIINVLVFHFTGLANFGGKNIIYVIILLITFIFFLCTMSSAICVTLRSEEVTNTIISNTVSVLSLFSGIMLPVASLGAVIEKISNISPVKWVITCVFELIYDGTSSQYGLILIGLLLISLLLIFIVHKKYKPEDYV